MLVRANMLIHRIARNSVSFKITRCKNYCIVFTRIALELSTFQKSYNALRTQDNNAYRMLQQLLTFCSACDVCGGANDSFCAVLRNKITSLRRLLLLWQQYTKNDY